MPASGVRARHRARQVGVATLAGGVIGAFLGPVLGRFGGAQLLSGAMDGAVIGFLLSTFEVLFLWATPGERLRLAPYPVFIAVRVAYYVLVILVGLHFSDTVLGLRGATAELVSGRTMAAAVIAFALALALSFFLAVERMLGPHVLRAFLVGRYHRPREEQRVFLFVDLAGSTSLAERLGGIRFHRLLNRFFFDITDPIVESGGEIYQYVGDEVVVSWPLETAAADASCVRCIYEMKDRIASRAEAYRREFGIVPTFRAGLHAGPVVVGQVGDWKQELMFVGDTINTAARIQQSCRVLRRRILASAAVLQAISVLPEDVRAESLGRVRLRGKRREIEVFALRRRRRRVADQGARPAPAEASAAEPPAS